ncbi:hypothetical protein ACIP1G_03530 [Pseudomonas sp. NPDC089392]|uniref:hypothetical protein n=1 Tax=Pseudomonas sp. NPDC089392 TaxID=3364459 RepID=UPI003811A66E
MQKNATSTRLFYQNGKLSTLIEGDQGHSIVRTADTLLAEQQSDGAQTSKLLGTDQSNSVIYSDAHGTVEATNKESP